ncbi:MAG: hypothetical protein GY768_32275 [Planctomycetaceae bacterium]|nr:hypothetical protein [Planctomycetaceae bacterium]
MMQRRRRTKTVFQRQAALESLEERRLLSAVPYGADADDTAEFMLGDVLVSVVLLESDGTLEPSTEDWTRQSIQETKERIVTGMEWWSDALDQQSSVHDLNFYFDFTFADQPVSTGYEPISRPSNDFAFWINDFFAAAEVPSASGFDARILAFNHRQRVEYGTDWAFTIFVVNAKQDSDNRFDASGSFSRAFAFAGGRFFVATSERPASTFAHEAAHMFWAMDEYAGGKSYDEHRGYYNSQNRNAYDGNPNPEARVRSIMDSHLAAFPTYAISESAMETIGWKDSDQDGIFDVFDVPHRLEGAGEFVFEESIYSFSGNTQVQTLLNQNPDGNGNAITLNRISRVEVRFDQSAWETVGTFDAYQVDLELEIPVPFAAETIEIRSVDDSTGVTSETWVDRLDSPLIGWQNVGLPTDVNGDDVVSPLDALIVINELNQNGSRELLPAPVESVVAFIDVNGDRFVSAIDALLVINQLNEVSTAVGRVPTIPAVAVGEGEPPHSDAFAVRWRQVADFERSCREPDESFEPSSDYLRKPANIDLIFQDSFYTKPVGEDFGGQDRCLINGNQNESWDPLDLDSQL